MDAVLGIMSNGLISFMLILVRMTGIFVIAPIFGRQNLPSYYKVGFAFLLSVILASTAKFTVPAFYNNILSFALLVIKEFAVGIIIGFVAYFIFSAIYLAGQIIDMQIGFGLVNVMDPINSIQVPITANFYYIILMIIFLLMNGHHVLIKALFDSYEAIPIAGAVFNSSSLLENITRLLGEMMSMGLKIAAPILATTLIADIALGVLMKTMPQLNIFVAGVPLKIIIGLVIMLLTVPLFILISDDMINNMKTEIYNIIKIMSP